MLNTCASGNMTDAFTNVTNEAAFEVLGKAMAMAMKQPWMNREAKPIVERCV